MIKKHIINIKNELSELQRINTELEALFGEWNLPPELLFNINLVIEELLTNVIFYGYSDEMTHKIELIFSLENDTMLIQIIDDAMEFNPLSAPEPDLNKGIEERKVGGLGIFFAKKLSDSIEYERTGNLNKLTIKKCIINKMDT